jgi:hypothetical protein
MPEPKHPLPPDPETFDDLPDPYPNRWNKPKMAEFLRVLASSHSVAMAARSVGMSRQSAYQLRARLKGEPFDLAWETAFQHSYDALHQAALERALHGVEVPVFQHGEQVGSYRKFDERLTCFLLAARNHQGAQQLGRYRAATDFYAERWDQLLEQVAEGHLRWRGMAHPLDPAMPPEDRTAEAVAEAERDAARAAERYTAPDPLPRGRGG